MSLTAASAQGAPPGAPDAGLVVTAPSRRQIPDLVTGFGVPTSHDRLARRRVALCPKILGVAPPDAAAISARILEIGRAAGLPEATACEPNFLVLVTPNDLADRRRLAQSRQSLFSSGRDPADNLQVDAFVRDDGAAAHVVYITAETSPTTGAETDDLATSATPLADAGGVLEAFGAPRVRFSPGRLVPVVDRGLVRVVAVLDAHRVRGVDTRRLSAFLAMLALAEIRLTPPVKGVVTITTLFDDLSGGRTPAEDLTFWDRAYLGALYAAPTAPDLSFQRAALASRIAHAVDVLKPQSDQASPPAAPGSGADHTDGPEQRPRPFP